MRRFRLRSVRSICLVTTFALICLLLLAATLLSVGCESGSSGILKVATEPATNPDPAFASARADILINQQVYDWLVSLG
jgi:hypothetical protein